VGWHALTFRSARLPPNSSFYQRTIAGNGSYCDATAPP
jgi:hypothetical protein